MSVISRTLCCQSWWKIVWIYLGNDFICIIYIYIYYYYYYYFSGMVRRRTQERRWLRNGLANVVPDFIDKDSWPPVKPDQLELPRLPRAWEPRWISSSTWLWNQNVSEL